MRTLMKARVLYVIAAGLGAFANVNHVRASFPRHLSLLTSVRYTAAGWVIVLMFLAIAFMAREDRPRLQIGFMMGATLAVIPLSVEIVLTSIPSFWPWIMSALIAGIAAANLRRLEPA